MERYPPEITSLLAPLIIIQGLDSTVIRSNETEFSDNGDLETGFNCQSPDSSIKIPSTSSDDNIIHNYLLSKEDASLIERKIPVSQGQISSFLSEFFLRHNIADSILPPYTEKGFIKQLYYHFKFIGSKCYIPSCNIDVFKNKYSAEQTTNSEVMDMPISPFFKESPYFGTILPLEWIQLYREILPAIFISIYNLEVTRDKAQDVAADRKLVEEICLFKHFLNLRKIRYLVILICDYPAKDISNSLSNRVEHIRMNTKLAATTGLAFLNSKEPKDISNFMLSIVHLVRPWCTDFYNALLKCSKMDIPDASLQYDKNLLYSRSSLKEALLEEFCGVTEDSTKSMEYCYESLINSFHSINFQKSKLWCQCRGLLDLVAIHIVRSYILLGNAKQSYKKFAIHIQNVTALLPQDLKDSYSYYTWLATQMSWLAQLIQKSPELIVDVNPSPQRMISLSLLGNMSRKQNSSPFCDEWITPQGGFIYLHACSLMRQRKICALHSNIDTSDPYMSTSLMEERKFPYSKKCLQLLNGALDMFSRSRKMKFNRAESYTYFQIAEEHFLTKNYSMAINNYLVALPIYHEEKWKWIESILLLRLFQCLIKLGNYHDSAIYYLKLCLLPEKLVHPLKFSIDHQKLKLDNHLEDCDPSERLTFNEKLINVNVVFEKQDVIIGNTFTMQAVMTSAMNTLMDHAIVENVQFIFGDNSKCIVVKHRSDLEFRVFETFYCDIKDFDYAEFESNLIFSGFGTQKIFNFDISSAIGKFSLNRVKLIIKTLDFDIENFVYLQAEKPGTSVQWLQPFKNGNGISGHKFVSLTLPSTTFNVQARIPKVNIRLNYDEVIFDGFEIPIKLFIDNNDVIDYTYNVISTANVGDKSLLISPRKPDNDNEIQSGKIKASQSKTENVFLFIPVLDTNFRTQGYDDKEMLCIHFCFEFTSIADGITTNTIKEVKIPIQRTFDIRLNIQPDLGPNRSLLLSSDSTLDKAFSPYDRTWKALVYMKNNSYMQLILNNFDLIVESSSKAKVKLIDDDFYPTPQRITFPCVEKKFVELPFILSSSSETKSCSFIDTKIYLRFSYTKSEKDFQLETLKPRPYSQLVWAGKLPLKDPRILVFLHELENNLIELNYLVENPSNETLKLHCAVSYSAEVEMYDIDTQVELTIAGESSKILKYKCGLAMPNINKRLVSLPEFKFYDTAHKLYLNQMLVTDHIVLKKNKMYYMNLRRETSDMVSSINESALPNGNHIMKSYK